MPKIVKEEELIARARDRFDHSMSVFGETYEEMIDDLHFLNGEQWPQALKAKRENDNRPCLRINKLPQFVDRVQGDMRQARPAIKLRPVDDHADEETAEILSGIIRNIETQSDAEAIYDSGGEAMVQCGYGAWRVGTDYISNNTFDQEIVITPVKNQFGVLLDANAKLWDRSDGRFGFVFEDMPRSLFEKRWPKKDPIPWDKGGKDLGDWTTERTIRVAEYFEKDIETSRLYLIHRRGEDRPEAVQELPPGEEGVDWTKLNERDVESAKVFWYRISGRQILEGPVEVPGGMIPIVPVYGKCINIQNKSHFYGLVRHAKDSQRLYNYYRSMDAETIALAPKAPWIMTPKMLGPHRRQWLEANERNFAYLLFEPDPNMPGQMPQRNIPQISNQAVMQNVMIADQELHDTIGLQLANLGKKSNEQSGRAVEARAKEGEVGQFTYVDNQIRAIKHTARIIVSMIPHVYDTQRIQRIIGEDGVAKNVKINQPTDDEQKEGERKVFDVTTGKYDVTVTAGPSYQTQRQESVAALLDFAQILEPQQRSVIAHKIAESSDWHGAQEISDLLKKLLPPGIIEPEEGKEPDPPTEQEIEAQAQEQAAREVALELQEVELEIKKAEAKEAAAKAAEAEAKAAIAEADATDRAAGYLRPEQAK